MKTKIIRILFFLKHPFYTYGKINSGIRILLGKCSFILKSKNKRSCNHNNLNHRFYKVNSYARQIKHLQQRAIHPTLLQMYCSHRFDILGTGWICWDKQNALSATYQNINWHIDLKSGYRWNSSSWYQDALKSICFNANEDIKIPWELARMQHLPQMAIGAGDDKNVIKEIKSQILDFIKDNPIKQGVNWACAMDVGIRVVNVLLANDIINEKTGEEERNNNFEQRLAYSAYEHGKHICENLEYGRINNNHYFSNICSLIIISSYLETTKETIGWLAFGLQEWVKEFDLQFHNDGGNFEASTSYHRLSVEMTIYAVAYIRGLPEGKVKALEKYKTYHWKYFPRLRSRSKQLWKVEDKVIQFPESLISKLIKIGKFTEAIIKPNGEVPQFGDNDSGRFIRLTSIGEFITNREAENKYINLKGYCKKVKGYGENENDLYWDENVNVHGNLLALLSGLFEVNIFDEFAKQYPIEKCIISNIAKTKFSMNTTSEYKNKLENKAIDVNVFGYKKDKEYLVESKKISLKEQLDYTLFPEFGLLVFKSKRIYLAIYYGGVGQRGLGGHSHNDKLSYELVIDDKELVKDPGTYIYSADPEMRKKFRSNEAHQTVMVKGFQQNDINGLFSSKQLSTCELLFLNKVKAVFKLKNDVYTHLREFIIENNKVIVKDWCDKPFQYPEKFKYYSKAYGYIEEVC